MNSTNKIDFVITWVDDTDPVWLEKRAEYVGNTVKEGNSKVRYRDWNLLKYWFRGVEKFAPWVRYVYFVTDNQKPAWLDIDHPKLKWIKHTDFIPTEYLPTFSSHPIEWNLHRIDGLSECFVYFNDDVFLIGNTKPEDFFKNGMPCDLPKIGPIYPHGFFNHMVFNNVSLLNKHFSLKKSIKSHWRKWIKHQTLKEIFKIIIYGQKDLIVGCESPHIHFAYKKKTFQELWEKEYMAIHETCLNRLRSQGDVTPWCIQNWQILSGDFCSKKPIGKLFHTATLQYTDELLNYMKKQKGKVICLNDNEDEVDFELHRDMIEKVFEVLFPDKSSFEL